MMQLPNKKDAIHKAWLYRILEGIADDAALAQALYFKGGTCAAMLGYLPRFSVDLDFDYAGEGKAADINACRDRLERVFKDLGLTVKDKSKAGIQYFLKYHNPDPNERSTVKLDASFPLFSSSTYEPRRLLEIDRIFTCQSKETMFAHKLVAPMDRFESTGSIAGRDIFDIHYFFLTGTGYERAIIEERRGVSAAAYLSELRDFLGIHITDKVLTEDLNSLLPYDEFRRLRGILKRETLSMIDDEIKRLPE